jgi:Rubredoxin-like zinc ribbon domain (DUF35_N)
MATPRPLRAMDPYAQAFWAYTQNKEFRLQQCSECHKFRWPPGPSCDNCLSDQYEWALMQGRGTGNRSGSENLTLAVQSPHSLPCHHGNTACIPSRGVGTDPIRSASPYSGPGNACGGIGGQGAGATRAQPHITGAAQPNVAEFFTSPVERSATTGTSTPSSESAPSRWSTGAPWPYSHPAACGNS